jgi:D-Tyr-tRNA(Tyr) deacylase
VNRASPPIVTDLVLNPLAVLQRVASASVTVDKELISSIGRGVLVFAAIGPNDTRKDAEAMASKVLKLKMWPDESGSSVRQTRSRRRDQVLTDLGSNGSKTCKRLMEKCFVVSLIHS